jgi:hypothetical protein
MPNFAVGWTNTSTQNSWTGGQYRLDGSGVVWLRGAMTGGTSGSVAFQLPPGFRTGITQTFAVAVIGSADGQATIGTNGNVQLYFAGSSAVLLDGIAFLAEN